VTINVSVVETTKDGKLKPLGNFEFVALPLVGHEIHVMGSFGVVTSVYIVTAVQHMPVELPKHSLGPEGGRVWITCVFSRDFVEDEVGDNVEH
jgi:hypothetical protein